MIVRTKDELAGMKEIGKICAETLNQMENAMKAGMTTKELDEIGGRILESYGAYSAPISCYKFPGYTCISINEVVAHGIPSSRVIQEGDIVNIDVSACKNGYFADTGKSILIPPVNGVKKRLAECSLKALEKALSVAVAGYPLNGLGLMVEKTAHKTGFKTIRNLCGHGVGKTLHEDPETIYNYYERKDKRILQAGMVLAVETFVSEREDYVIEEKDGWTLRTPNNSITAQFEHTIIVTDKDPVILTLV